MRPVRDNPGMTIRAISPDDVALWLAEGAVFIDVREDHEFARGRIPGSVSHPLSSFDPEALKALIAAQPETEGRTSMETMLHGYNIEPTAAPEVVWNFEKFLIVNSDSKLIQILVRRRFKTDTPRKFVGADRVAVREGRRPDRRGAPSRGSQPAAASACTIPALRWCLSR